MYITQGVFLAKANIGIGIGIGINAARIDPRSSNTVFNSKFEKPKRTKTKLGINDTVFSYHCVPRLFGSLPLFSGFRFPTWVFLRVGCISGAV